MTKIDPTALDALIAAVEAGTATRVSVEELAVAVFGVTTTSGDISAAYNKSLDAAFALREALLPGWWWQIGSCCVSDDARVAPDFNNTKNGDALAKMFHPSIDWELEFDIDQRPPGNPARAWLLSTLKAYHAKVAE